MKNRKIHTIQAISMGPNSQKVEILQSQIGKIKGGLRARRILIDDTISIFSPEINVRFKGEKRRIG